jgi:ubiquilin
MLSNPAFLE